MNVAKKPPRKRNAAEKYIRATRQAAVVQAAQAARGPVDDSNRTKRDVVLARKAEKLQGQITKLQPKAAAFTKRQTEKVAIRLERHETRLLNKQRQWERRHPNQAPNESPFINELAQYQLRDGNELQPIENYPSYDNSGADPVAPTAPTTAGASTPGGGGGGIPASSGSTPSWLPVALIGAAAYLFSRSK